MREGKVTKLTLYDIGEDLHKENAKRIRQFNDQMRLNPRASQNKVQVIDAEGMTKTMTVSEAISGYRAGKIKHIL